VLWDGSDDALLNGGVKREAKALATVQVSAAEGQHRAERAVEAVADALRWPSGVWNLDAEPITDVIMAPCPAQIQCRDYERLNSAFNVAPGIVVIPVDDDLRDAVYGACDPPVSGTTFSVDLRGQPLYAFTRPDAPREHPRAFDPDQRLQMCVALSRLVRPTSLSLQYAVRLIGRLGAERHEVIPGPVRGFGAEAWTMAPEHDWLSPEDFGRLRELMSLFDANSFDARSRVARAFWYHEYAARTYMVDVRWPLVATALETLLGTNKDPTSQRFIQRVPQLATLLGLPELSNTGARRMRGMRSALVHGQKHGGLGEDDFALYRIMEGLLREALRRAVVDLDFRGLFADDASVSAAFPLKPVVRKPVSCPSCGQSFIPPINRRS